MLKHISACAFCVYYLNESYLDAFLVQKYLVECCLDAFLLVEIFEWMLLRCFCFCFLHLKYLS